MNEDILHRIEVSVQIDVLLELIEESDGQGIVWCEGPYDVQVPLALPATETLPITTDDDWAWFIRVLIGVGVALLVAVTLWIILLWSIYAALGVVLWLMVSSVS